MSIFKGFSRKVLGFFARVVFQKMPVFERNVCEICRRKSAQNTEKHKTKLCAQVPERPLSQRPLFSAAETWFWEIWTENRGAPKKPNSTTRDLTPHLRPSDSGDHLPL